MRYRKEEKGIDRRIILENRAHTYGKSCLLLLLCFLLLLVTVSCSDVWEPVLDQSEEETQIPEDEPTTEPTDVEIPEPTPAVKPADEEIQEPTPTVEPTDDVSSEPTQSPGATPTPSHVEPQNPEPTEGPGPTPAEEPTNEPTSKPSPKPTLKPTPKPTISPTTVPVITPPIKDIFLEAEEYAQQIIDLIIDGDMKEADKVRAVHDYIILNTAYYEGDISDLNSIPKSCFSVEGVLYKAEAVCQGYAETFELFMELLGIEYKLVEGISLLTESNNGHAWNMVRLDGDWYQVDVTWDDPIPDQEGKVQYQYFLVTDEVMEVDHSWNRKEYPACNSTDFQYFMYEDYMIDSIDDYEDKFIELYNSGLRTITILYPEEGYPDMNFIANYDFKEIIIDGVPKIPYQHFSPRRVGDYTLYTVMIE